MKASAITDIELCDSVNGAQFYRITFDDCSMYIQRLGPEAASESPLSAHESVILALIRRLEEVDDR